MEVILPLQRVYSGTRVWRRGEETMILKDSPARSRASISVDAWATGAAAEVELWWMISLVSCAVIGVNRDDDRTRGRGVLRFYSHIDGKGRESS